MIDIMDIRKAVKDGKLNFYVKDNVIYCEDTQNGERVRVSSDEKDGLKKNSKYAEDSSVYGAYGGYR